MFNDDIGTDTWRPSHAMDPIRTPARVYAETFSISASAEIIKSEFKPVPDEILTFSVRTSLMSVVVLWADFIKAAADASSLLTTLASMLQLDTGFNEL